jgi:PKD repeat protein
VVKVGANKEDAIKVGKRPFGIAITPDQSPAASFAAPRIRPGVPATLDASSSKDPDTPIAGFAWNFGDGQSQSVTSPTTTHVFATPGTYTASLKEVDAEGCSTSLIFTGQTASCSGNAAAQITQTVKWPTRA